MGIGKRLKEARENAGLTQEQLGKLIGVTGSAITNYEKETSHPKEPIMYALIDALEVEPNFLFQDCVKLPKTKKSPSLEDGDEELLKKYHHLNQYNRGRVSGYIDMLLEEAKSQEDSGCVAG